MWQALERASSPLGPWKSDLLPTLGLLLILCHFLFSSRSVGPAAEKQERLGCSSYRLASWHKTKHCESPRGDSRVGQPLTPCQQALRREGPHLCIPTAMVSWAQGDGTAASGRRREAEVGAGTSFIYLGEMGLDFPICDVVRLGGGSHIAMESFLKLLPVPRV